MLLEIEISNNQRRVLFGVFFSKIILESFGCGLYMRAAYTRVFTAGLLGFKTSSICCFTKERTSLRLSSKSDLIASSRSSDSGSATIVVLVKN